MKRRMKEEVQVESTLDMGSENQTVEVPQLDEPFVWCFFHVRCSNSCAAGVFSTLFEVLNSDSEQITLEWPNPELFNAPLVGYNIYLDDGMGGLVGHISFFGRFAESNSTTVG